MAVAMGFVQLFSGLGQVSGVGISSALFQAILNSELRERLHGPDSEKVSLIKLPMSVTLTLFISLSNK